VLQGSKKLNNTMINETKTNPKAETYIKDGDGNKVYINRKGRELFNKMIAQKGGGKSAAPIIGVHENTISNFKNNGYCTYDTWIKFFEVIKTTILEEAA